MELHVLGRHVLGVPGLARYLSHENRRSGPCHPPTMKADVDTAQPENRAQNALQLLVQLPNTDAVRPKNDARSSHGRPFSNLFFSGRSLPHSASLPGKSMYVWIEPERSSTSFRRSRTSGIILAICISQYRSTLGPRSTPSRSSED